MLKRQLIKNENTPISIVATCNSFKIYEVVHHARDYFQRRIFLKWIEANMVWLRFQVLRNLMTNTYMIIIGIVNWRNDSLSSSILAHNKNNNNKSIKAPMNPLTFNVNEVIHPSFIWKLLKTIEETFKFRNSCSVLTILAVQVNPMGCKHKVNLISYEPSTQYPAHWLLLCVSSHCLLTKWSLHFLCYKYLKQNHRSWSLFWNSIFDMVCQTQPNKTHQLFHASNNVIII